MNKKKILIVIAILIATFFFVYSPHINYRFPIHIDEWHHITETLKLGSGEYQIQGTDGIRTMGFELGFHAILLPVSRITNLVQTYQFFPAIWAMVSALTLFLLVYKKTNKFLIGIIAMIFFASIKTNTNLAGPWFFTPLTFSVPFIFLYLYLFTEGIEKQNKKFIIWSLIIMAFLLPIHAIAVLFAIPFLIIHALFYLDYIKKEKKFFLSFLAIPIIGAIFYSIMTQTNIFTSIISILKDLQFKTGWGVVEIKNSFFELYSPIGYILAAFGAIGIFLFQVKPKKFIPYIILPLTILISIFIYRLTGTSFLSPYQRNMFYLAISLPILSAFGTFYIIEIISLKTKKELTKKILTILIIAIVAFFTFQSYFFVPERFPIYHAIEEKDYATVDFLSTLPPNSTIMGWAFISTTIYPISQQNPVATIFFYGNRSKIREFYGIPNCVNQEKIMKEENATYAIFNSQVPCNWELIYNGENVVYKI
ncbi:hypothetical protein HN935_01125 [archaeon]|jgi:hypothetical protein|nr:hypothetical protein [archaeon]